MSVGMQSVRSKSDGVWVPFISLVPQMVGLRFCDDLVSSLLLVILFFPAFPFPPYPNSSLPSSLSLSRVADNPNSSDGHYLSYLLLYASQSGIFMTHSFSFFHRLLSMLFYSPPKLLPSLLFGVCVDYADFFFLLVFDSYFPFSFAFSSNPPPKPTHHTPPPIPKTFASHKSEFNLAVPSSTPPCRTPPPSNDQKSSL